MIAFQKYTVEDILRKGFANGSTSIETVMKADPSSTLNLSITYNYTVPARYAKEILKEYINENSNY